MPNASELCVVRSMTAVALVRVRGDVDQLKAGIHGNIQTMVRSEEEKFAREGVMGCAGTGSTSKAKVSVKDSCST